MRRLVIPTLLLTLAGCQTRPPRPILENENAGVASVIPLGDSRFAGQLNRGFYQIEQNAWRWTAGRFSVTLKTPPGAAQKGAFLVVKFSVPPTILEKHGNVTLNMSVNGIRIEPATYTAAGQQQLRRPVPAEAFIADVVACDFILDKILPPSPADKRELGIIVSSIGLESLQ